MKARRHSYLRNSALALAAIISVALPAFAIDDPKQEKRLEALEDKFFSQTYKSDSDDVRLARVEDMLFNHARTGATAERLSTLEDAISTIKTSTKTPPARTPSSSSANSANTGVSESSAGNNSRYRHFTDMDDHDLDDDSFDSQASNFYNQGASGNAKNTVSTQGSKSGSLMTQQLAAMETQIFGKPNLKLPLTTRIKKLEQNVLASNADTSSMSLPDRVKNLWTSLNTPGATAGGASSSKSKDRAPQPVTTDGSAQQIEAPRKQKQSKAAEDDVSDDQAMAEYLQKLRKGSSASQSSGDSSPVKKAGRNKSGWMDDAEIPKGKDPDYASTDDNPPIVIGGNGAGSSMQAQGYVQNLGSGMGMSTGMGMGMGMGNSMPMQSSGPELFSKLGQALGGAVSGANNPYGYGGGGMYGGMPYGYGGMSPYGLSPYGMSPYSGYGGLSPYGGGYGFSPPVMGPPMGIGGYGVNPYGLGGPRPGNPYGVNPYAGSPYGGATPYGGRRW